MSGLVVDQVASRVNRDCYAMLGVSLSPAALHQAARTAVLLAAVTALTVVFCLAAAVVLTMVRPG